MTNFERKEANQLHYLGTLTRRLLIQAWILIQADASSWLLSAM